MCANNKGFIYFQFFKLGHYVQFDFGFFLMLPYCLLSLTKKMCMKRRIDIQRKVKGSFTFNPKIGL